MQSAWGEPGIRVAAMVAIILVFALEPAALEGQAVLRGVVVDDETEGPLPGARVDYMDNQRRRTRDVVTDSDGQFVLPDVPIGGFRLYAARIGYQPVTTPRWWIERGDTLSVEIRLHTSTILLAPLEIVGRARGSPVLEDFHHRRDRGFGTYFTREDIEEMGAGLVTDVLLTAPGVMLDGSGRGAQRTIIMSRTRALPGPGNTGCSAQIFLDGVHMNRGLGEQVAVDDLVTPEQVEGIEVYRGLSGVPAAFATEDARCGVVAIWTRRGFGNH